MLWNLNLILKRNCSLMNKKIEILDLGKKDYKETWDIQEGFFSDLLKIKSENGKLKIPVATPNRLIFVEHPPVFTLGKSGKMENLLLSDEKLKEIGAEFYKINRGGDITYHGPGQLVGYPILDLENFFTDIHKYLRLIEESVILTLQEYGVTGERSAGETGVWIDVGKPSARKICALGVRASRWVTMHGFAFNINTNLDYFNYIIPCGIKNKGVTSLAAELGGIDDESKLFGEVKAKFTNHFLRLFEALPYKKTEAETSA